jgi:DNA-binding transcriptional LysR family regulator
MTLVQLKHFLSLAQTASFSKSAAALHLTQPALSRSIKALEGELGHRLFDRVGRFSELTAFGRLVLTRAQDLVMAADDLRDHAKHSVQGHEGMLRIGMGSGPGAILMTPLLLRAAQERPKLQLSITRANTELLVQALRDRSLDALVVDQRSMRAAPDLETHLLAEMKGAFMARRGHPLMRRRGGVSIDDLLRFPIATTPLSDEITRVLVDRYGPRLHPDACVTLRCDEVSSLVQVAQQSDTVLFAIRAAAPSLLPLKMQPALDIAGRYGLVTLRNRTAPAAIDLVRTLMGECMVDL